MDGGYEGCGFLSIKVEPLGLALSIEKLINVRLLVEVVTGPNAISLISSSVMVAVLSTGVTTQLMGQVALVPNAKPSIVLAPAEGVIGLS